MQNTIKFTIILLLVFILVVFFISLNKSSNYDTKYLSGNKLTNFKLKSFYDNKVFINNDFKENNFTLINFWASWCAPCRVEHPVLIKLSKEKNLKILGINFKDKKANASKFLETLGNPYDFLAKDELGKQSVIFGIYGIPESILINKDFTIIRKYIGPLNDKDFNEIKGIIN